jgi:hypothetical protein
MSVKCHNFCGTLYSFHQVTHVLKDSHNLEPGLEVAGCQWPKADHILEMAGKNKFELPK